MKTLSLKKLTAIKGTLLLVTLLLLGACDDNPATPADDTSALEGTWTVTSGTASNCSDPDDNGTFSTTCTSTDCLKVEFKSDGTFVATTLEDGVTETTNGTYSVSGDQLTITEDGQSEVTTFAINNNTLIISGTDDGCDVSTTLTKD